MGADSPQERVNMPVFLSKEDILGNVQPALGAPGAPTAQPPPSAPGGLGEMFSGSSLDQIERLLGHVVRITDNVIQLKEKGRQLTTPPPAPAAPPVMRETPAPPPPAMPTQKPLEINEDGVREWLAELIGKFKSADESLKNKTLAELLSDYDNPLGKPFIESQILKEFKANLPRMIK